MSLQKVDRWMRVVVLFGGMTLRPLPPKKLGVTLPKWK